MNLEQLLTRLVGKVCINTKTIHHWPHMKQHVKYSVWSNMQDDLQFMLGPYIMLVQDQINDGAPGNE